MRVRIRGQKTEITNGLRSHVHRRVRFALGRFAGAVQEVSLLLEESEERRTRFCCSVTVLLEPRAQVSVAHADGDAPTAVEGALERATRAVERKLAQRGFALHDEGE